MKIRAKMPEPFLTACPPPSGKTLTRSMPLEGDRLLKTNPQSPSFSSWAVRRFAQASMRSVRSRLVRVVTRRGRPGSPSRCIDSRGTPSPHSTSGQTGTYSTQAPRVSRR